MRPSILRRSVRRRPTPRTCSSSSRQPRTSPRRRWKSAGRAEVRAFIEAGFWALGSIALLLWITLKRFTDVLLTLVPLIVAGMITLEICVMIGLPLNFANIIALPLLLGIGV